MPSNNQDTQEKRLVKRRKALFDELKADSHPRLLDLLRKYACVDTKYGPRMRLKHGGVIMSIYLGIKPMVKFSTGTASNGLSYLRLSSDRVRIGGMITGNRFLKIHIHACENDFGMSIHTKIWINYPGEHRGYNYYTIIIPHGRVKI